MEYQSTQRQEALSLALLLPFHHGWLGILSFSISSGKCPLSGPFLALAPALPWPPQLPREKHLALRRGCLRRRAAPATELPMSRPPSSECAQVAHACVLARDAGVVTARTNLVARSWLWIASVFGCCCCCRCSWLLALLIACSGASQLVLLAVRVDGCEALGMSLVMCDTTRHT